MLPQLPVQPSNKCMCTDTLNYYPFLIFDGTWHKKNHKPTDNLPSTVIAAADNHFLPPLDDDDGNDANTANLMGKYDGGGKKKGKGGHRCRYRDDNEIKALHGLCEEQKDDDDGDWGDVEEKEHEEDDGNDDDIVNITAVKFFDMPEEAFLGKETDIKKKK